MSQLLVKILQNSRILIKILQILLLKKHKKRSRNYKIIFRKAF